MITIIIPTRNRAYTLEKVAESYYQQKHVNEIIFVDDCGEDNTKEIIDNVAKNYPQITTEYISHESRKGAAGGRITGYTNATNEYVLFGEDDAYLEQNYTEILLSKIKESNTIGLVSGRIIYLQVNEKNDIALKRFGLGKEGVDPFNKIKFGWNSNAYIDKDTNVPMTHALFLTKKSLLEELSYDEFYSKGNGYREESDFQLNAFSKGWDIVITNDTHCFHLHKDDVSSGGQRVDIYKQLYWNIYYTKYFYDKYFDIVKNKCDISYSKNIALILFTAQQFYELIIKHFLRVPYKFLKGLYQ